MHAGEIFLIIFFNSLIFAGFYYIYIRIMERRLRYVKTEVEKLEDLVAAIIEEFEEVAASTEVVASHENQSEAGSEMSDSKESDSKKSGSEMSGPIDINQHPMANQHLAAVLSTPEHPPSVGQNTKTPTGDESSPGQRTQPADSRHRKILELWRNGIAVEEIARQLGTGRGEVQLVLGLYQKM